MQMSTFVKYLKCNETSDPIYYSAHVTDCLQ